MSDLSKTAITTSSRRKGDFRKDNNTCIPESRNNLNKIIVRDYFLLNNALSLMKFSHLANAALKNAIYQRFLHEISKTTSPLETFSVTLLNTNYMTSDSQFGNSV